MLINKNKRDRISFWTEDAHTNTIQPSICESKLQVKSMLAPSIVLTNQILDYAQVPTFAILAWASYQIRNIAGCACAGNAKSVFPRHRLQRKPLVSDLAMHHDTCVTHVPWCMAGSLASGGGENVHGIPGACAPASLRIWQEAHALLYNKIT